MENKFSYAAVGVFVTGFAIILIALIVWLTVGTQKINYIEYKVITTESVSGLSVNSIVDYNGVDVGTVKNVSLNDQDPNSVIIILDIAEGTPIKDDTQAILKTRGVTGLLSVSLRGGSPKSLKLVPTKEDPVPEIVNGPSLAKRLDTAFTEISQSVSGLSEKLDTIVSKENAESISSILSNVNTISKNLANSSGHLDIITKEVQELIANIEPKITKALEAIDSFAAIADNVEKTSEDLQGTLTNADKMLASWDSAGAEFEGLGRSARTQIPNLNSTFIELNNTLYQLSILINQLTNEPNSLIMGVGKPKAGPGE